MDADADIPPRFYGQLVETTARVVTWNVRGLYGPWEQREAAIAATIEDAPPDVVVLTESWAKGLDNQCTRLSAPLDLPHHAFSGIEAQEDSAALSGVAVVSMAIVDRSAFTFGMLRGVYAELSGPRGPMQVYGIVMDAWWFDQSDARQKSVRDLLEYANERQDERTALVLCGDFNADPDSDENPCRARAHQFAVPGPVVLRRMGGGRFGPQRSHLGERQSVGASASLARSPNRLRLHSNTPPRRRRASA